MVDVRRVLRQYPNLYQPLQWGWYGVRRFAETHLFGTRLQEWIWRTRHLYKGRSWASGYLDTLTHPHRQQLLTAIGSFAPFTSVLEVGCNSGPNLILLHEQFPEATLIGVDINEAAIRVGREYAEQCGVKNIDLRVGRADDLTEMKDKSIDLVFTDAVLMFIGPDKIRKVLGEMCRVARKGLVLHEYHAASPPAGNYDGGRWVYNYVDLAASCFPLASVEISKSRSSGGGWDEYGSLIQVKW